MREDDAECFNNRLKYEWIANMNLKIISGNESTKHYSVIGLYLDGSERCLQCFQFTDIVCR